MCLAGLWLFCAIFWLPVGAPSRADAAPLATSAPVAPIVSGVHWSHRMGGTADATVSWHPVGASAKNAPSSYSVTTQGASCTTATGAASSCTLTSLPAGRTYDFAVTATNSAGTSPTTSLSSTLDPEGQSISFPTLSNVTFGQAPLTLTAVATSGLPVTYGAQGACEVTGDVLNITGAGDCSVTASQDGSTAFQAATPAANYFSIAPHRRRSR